MFDWIKKGKVFQPDGRYHWMISHVTPMAAVPLEDRVRVYYSSRSVFDDCGNYLSYISFLDLDVDDLSKIIYVHDKVVLDLGGYGYFDEFGTMVAKPAVNDDTIYLYYMGWQRLSSKTAPYQVMLGLAQSKDGGVSFNKYSNGPVLGIDSIDPISIGNVSVLIDGDLWRMWYTSYTRWEISGIKPTPEYNIKYAESRDGIHWHKTGIVCIDEDIKGGVATPSVIKLNGLYHMWFGYRQPYEQDGRVHGYKIGYASSEDGITWKRNDSLAGITCSSEGWDSEMICYPHVVQVRDKLIMFYCGNGFGLTGFGYAELNL